MEDIQDLLGHTDIVTTKNMYTHVEIEPLRESVKKLTDYLVYRSGGQKGAEYDSEPPFPRVGIYGKCQNFGQT